MPISIPRLRRLQPSTGLPKNDRLNVKVGNQANLIQGNFQALGSLVESGADVFQEIEDEKIESIHVQNDTELTLWRTEKLQELKNHKGDPTKAYANYDALEKEKVEELLGRNQDASERVKRHTTSKLNKSVVSGQVATLKQRGAQQSEYDNNVFTANVNLKKNNLPISAGYIQKDDVGSFLPFDKNLADVRTLIAKRAIKNGTAEKLPDDAKSWSHIYENEDGEITKVNMSNVAKAQVAKELNQGVVNSVRVLQNSGHIEEAKLLQEKYKIYIDPKSAAAISKKFGTIKVKDKAHDFMQEIEAKPEEEQLRKIEAIKDSELKSELLKIKDTNDNRRESIRNRRHKVNYNTLGNHVIQKQTSGSPFYGLADLERDPVYKETWDQLDVKGKKAITELVKPASKSTTASQVKIQNLLFGNDEEHEIETISPTDFNTYLQGLSKADRRRYTSMYTNIRTETSSEKRSFFRKAESSLIDHMLVDGLVEKNKFGKFDEDDQITIIEANDKLIDHLSTYGTNLDEKQLKDFVKAYTTSLVQEKAFNPPERKGAKKKKSVATGEVEMTPRKRMELKRGFRDEFGYLPKSSDEKFKTYARRELQDG